MVSIEELDYINSLLTEDYRWNENAYEGVRGQPAGGINSKGYYSINFNFKGKFKHCRLHWLVWYRAYGELPAKGYFIDHIDRNPLNNDLSNLRLSTHQENCRNRSRPANAAGARGVYKRGNRYRVQLTINGKRESFGTYEDLETASMIAEQKRSELYGEFAYR